MIVIILKLLALYLAIGLIYVVVGGLFGLLKAEPGSKAEKCGVPDLPMAGVLLVAWPWVCYVAFAKLWRDYL